MSYILKKRYCSLRLRKKKTNDFWKEVIKVKGNTTVSRCIDGISIIQDTVKNFDKVYQEVLDNSECQARHTGATDPMFCRTDFSFYLKDLVVTIERLNPGIGF